MIKGMSGQKWYESRAFLTTALVLFGPLALPLLWVHRSISLRMKVILTIALIILAVLLYKSTMHLTELLNTQLEQLKRIQSEM